jgi:Family of unknown function (DUF6037)
VGHNFAIFKDVSATFDITLYIDEKDTFFALRQAIFQNAGSGHRLSLSDFFNEFNERIPAHVTQRDVATPDDVVRYYPDIEESAKRYFLGWQDNNVRGENVTPKNLAKTRRLLGQRAHDFSLRRNQSTRWTHLRERAAAFFIPE